MPITTQLESQLLDWYRTDTLVVVTDFRGTTYTGVLGVIFSRNRIGRLRIGHVGFPGVTEIDVGLVRSVELANGESK